MSDEHDPPPAGPEVTAEQAMASLRSDVCPSCGGPKRRGHSLCRSEFGKLAPQLRLDLYTPFANGYVDKLRAALGVLGATGVCTRPGQGTPGERRRAAELARRAERSDIRRAAPLFAVSKVGKGKGGLKFEITCRHCGEHIEWRGTPEGRPARCPGCGKEEP